MVALPRHPFARVLVALLLTVPASAQVVDRIVPEAFAPGDVVTLQGQGLAGLTHVSFKATVGGFVGMWTISQPVAVATDTEVLVVAPTFNNFVPPIAGSSPFGSIFGMGLPSLPAFYMEGTFGQLTTAGKGSVTPGADFDKLVISFALASGAPVPGNANFKLKLENGPPGAQAFVAAGLPDATPIPFAGGVLAVDVNQIFVLIGSYPVDAQGDAVAALPIPSVVGATVALQWFTRDPATNAPLISNALVAQL